MPAKGESGGDNPRFPEIQGMLGRPGPSRITAENSQMQEKGWECLAHLLTLVTERPSCHGRSGMRNSPGKRIHGALRTPTPSWGWAAPGGGGGESNSFQNLPRFCPQAKEDQGSSKGDPALGMGCGRIHVDVVAAGTALGKAQQLPGRGRAPVPAFCSTGPQNSMLFLGRNQEILLLGFPFG